MPDLPPLESIRVLEAAARHESFVRAAQELGVTAATVSHRVRALERHIGARLFSRHARGVRVNTRGREYAQEIRRIFGDLAAATERHREFTEAKRLKLVAVEVVAEKWLMPRLADFKAAYPDISIEFETDHREVDPDRREFDIWIAFTDRVAETLHGEKLFEETLLPVCSTALLTARGRPREPADLHGWPLLYDLHWTTYWSYWFAHHGAGAPDLSQASGFRLYSMMIQAAVDGMGVALGHSLMVARELEEGTLVGLFEAPVTAPARYLLVTAPAAVHKPQVRAFRNWILVGDAGMHIRIARADALDELGRMPLARRLGVGDRLRPPSGRPGVDRSRDCRRAQVTDGSPPHGGRGGSHRLPGRRAPAVPQAAKAGRARRENRPGRGGERGVPAAVDGRDEARPGRILPRRKRARVAADRDCRRVAQGD